MEIILFLEHRSHINKDYRSNDYQMNFICVHITQSGDSIKYFNNNVTYLDHIATFYYI